MRLTIITLILLGTAISASAQKMPRTKSAEGAVEYIISPTDGDVVTSPVTIIFGLKGMGVAPAGTDFGKTGHHHLFVDVDQLPDFGKPMPADANHLHFGGGQTEHDLVLPPGEHTLQLVLGDRVHVAHDPPLVSEKITITVK
jgi:hypothetical protein